MEDDTMATRKGPYKRSNLDGKQTYTAEFYPPLHRYAVMVIVTAPDQFEAGNHVKAAAGGVVTQVWGQDRDMVVVDRARFERLREYVAADRAYMESPNFDESVYAVERQGRAEDALQPGDLDPLP